MKQFFKFTFASMLGSLLALFGGFFLLLWFFSLLASAFNTEVPVTVGSNTVMEMELDYPLTERTIYAPAQDFGYLFPKISKKLGLKDVLASIERAKYDNNISAIYLELDNLIVGGTPTLEAIRKALIDFKDSGKMIIAHGNYISQKAYYLASVADKLFLTPTGSLDFKGLAMQLTFFKKTLEKLDIDMQIFKAGKYKGAVEYFSNEKMSAPNREQLTALINSVHESMLSDISASIGIPEAELKEISDDMKIRTPEDAYKYGLVDSLMYEEEVKDYIRSEARSRNGSSPKKISLKDYFKAGELELPYSKDRIAVIYAVGEIHNGTGDAETIGKDNIVEAIRTAGNNSRVKAIVLRVNSPGGSALTSDIIWNEVRKVREEMPVVVSFGDVAASGGYYISCAADTIVAEPTTITGSIGVFGLVPNLKEFFDNNLGITFDRVKTGKYSDMMTTARPFTKDEKNIIQKDIERTYETFVNRVANGRGMTFDQVHEIAQGRVWSGVQAKELGLVDELGGLEDAIEIAAGMAGLSGYRLVEYPKLKEPFEELLDIFYEESASALIKNELGENYKYYSLFKKVSEPKLGEARLPFEYSIN